MKTPEAVGKGNSEIGKMGTGGRIGIQKCDEHKPMEMSSLDTYAGRYDTTEDRD